MKTRGSKYYSLRCMVMNASQSLNAKEEILAATTRGHSISRKVCGLQIHSEAGSSGSNHGNQISIQEGLLLRNPPVVIQAAFQFVSTHPFFFVVFLFCRFHLQTSMPASLLVA